MAGKKAGRKQESSRPGIGHDAGAGRMPRGHSRCVWLGGSCGVLALGLWHLLDVRAGVLETGDGFLYGWYWRQWDTCFWYGGTMAWPAYFPQQPWESA